MDNEDQQTATTTYDLSNFRESEDAVMFKPTDRPHGTDKNTSVRMLIAIPGKKDPKPFSVILHGADLSRVIKDSYQEDLMFVSWKYDNPVLPLVKEFSAWVEDQFRKKVFSNLSMRMDLGYNDAKYTYGPKNTNFPLPFDSLLWDDKGRGCWSMFLRPTMMSGVSPKGLKFKATTVLHRPSRKNYPITAMRSLAGPGILYSYSIDLGGKTGKKRFKITPYSLHYDDVIDARNDGTEIDLARADAIAPLAEKSQEELDAAEALFAGAIDDANDNLLSSGLVATAGVDDDDTDGALEAPAPDVPLVTAARPILIAAPLKALRK